MWYYNMMKLLLLITCFNLLLGILDFNGYFNFFQTMQKTSLDASQ